METTHRVVAGDARSLDLPADSVDLVVTSPPYPMIEMWDDTFAALDPAIGDALEDDEADRAYDLMHDALDAVWAEVARVLVPGGIACVNVGDATRSVGDGFRSFPNHATITTRLRDRGLRALPDVVWRKPTNSAAKFMGSGMLPPNAYPTLEHEHLLVFRNGERRTFPPGDDDRYASAYFWEERNRWFSDLWAVTGEAQGVEDGARERSGAFPLAVPYRLIAMFSVYGDTVLDPFLGTGTTSVAAMVAGRHSVGYERDADLLGALEERVDGVPDLSRDLARGRLADHAEWVAGREADDDPPGYEAVNYDTRVMTEQERRLRLYAATDVASTEAGYRVTHEAIETMPAGQ